MNLLKLNRKKPANKRATESETDDEYDAATGDDPSAQTGGSRRRPKIGIALLLTAVAVLAIKRRRS